ncbi:GFA family protein [Rhizobium viscosum]|uniref:GFA family protein n=1 Tax=Rhizobium viscosum TaxID=1673 RepID=UPI00178B1AB3|nr:GFA family protein [Rhizobium viscosum]
MEENMARHGGCLCGTVRYQVEGEPYRIGLCHCADCRKESGSSFTSFAHWPRDSFSFSGVTKIYRGRSFCPRCGSTLFCLNDKDVEIRLGSLDDTPARLLPEFEVWTKRREPWLPALEWATQHVEDTPCAERDRTAP